MKFIIF